MVGGEFGHRGAVALTPFAVERLESLGFLVAARGERAGLLSGFRIGGSAGAGLQALLGGRGDRGGLVGQLALLAGAARLGRVGHHAL